jgi:hypothetical protein
MLTDTSTVHKKGRVIDPVGKKDVVPNRAAVGNTTTVAKIASEMLSDTETEDEDSPPRLVSVLPRHPLPLSPRGSIPGVQSGHRVTLNEPTMPTDPNTGSKKVVVTEAVGQKEVVPIRATVGNATTAAIDDAGTTVDKTESDTISDTETEDENSPPRPASLPPGRPLRLSPKFTSRPSTEEPSFTITFSEVVENGVGMQKTGQIAASGFSAAEMESARQRCIAKTSPDQVRLIDLHDEAGLGSTQPRDDSAVVLHVQGAAAAFGVDEQVLLKELQHPWDKQKKMKGQIKDSQARYNVCYGDEPQSPDIEAGQGTIIPFQQVPEIDKIRNQLAGVLGCKATALMAEGNFYHHRRAGIGFHGDAERRIVVAFRFGAPLKLHFQAFQRFEPVGNRVELNNLQSGDMYVMGDKAVGNDWRKSVAMTWRHAAERFHAQTPKYVKCNATLLKARAAKKRKRDAPLSVPRSVHPASDCPPCHPRANKK